MKTLKFAFILFLFSITTSTLLAQNADEIISKHIAAIGGADKLRAVQGIKMEMSVNTQGMDIPVEMVQLKGGKMYLKLNLQGSEMTQMASDGSTIWATNFMTMKAEKVDEEAAANAKLSNQDFPDALLDFKEKGYTAEYIGKETKEAVECYKIKLTKKPITIDGVKTDDIVYYFLDTKSNMTVATETEVGAGPSKGEKSIAIMKDYKNVDGIMYPFIMNQGGQDLKITKITLNPKVDEKSFAFPTE